MAIELPTAQTVRIGQFNLKGEATYNSKFNEKLDEFSEVETVLEEDGRAKWRANASVTWRLNNWGAGWFRVLWWFDGSWSSHHSGHLRAVGPSQLHQSVQ